MYGIQVNIVSVNDKTYNNYVDKRNYDILLTGINVGLTPSFNRYFFMGNVANYNNDEAINILTDIYSISDENLLKEKYKRLQSIYQDERPYIGLYFNKTTIIYGKDLMGTVSPTWYSYLYNIESWYKKE